MYAIQIENEYNHIQLAYEADGDNYVQWAAKMAVSLNVGVPWVMCKQKDAPDPVVCIWVFEYSRGCHYSP
jgi:hypothetical protein